MPRPDVRVMVDANVLLAGVVFPRWPWEILRHAVRGDFQLVLCPYVIRQARRRIAQRFPEFLEAFDGFLFRCPYELVPDPSPEDVQAHIGLVRDVTDVPVALAAMRAGVDHVVSEDKDLTAVDVTTAQLHLPTSRDGLEPRGTGGSAGAHVGRVGRMSQPQGGTMSDRTESLARLCQEFRVDILYVFGSRASEVKEWLMGDRLNLPPDLADVDVGVKTAREVRLSVRDKVRMALALEDLLGVTRVDLVCFSDADPFLAANIVRGERLYARDTYEADEYDLYVLRRAGDLAPLERERIALVLGEEG
jgi:predicted nucleotidyltransferase/predicted nucleic acid-binding protein